MQESIIRLILFVAIVLVVSSLFSFWRFVYPAPFVGTRTPADFGMNAEEISLTTSDGIELSAWLLEPDQKPAAAVIVLHGYPAERSDMLNIAQKLYPNFTLLLPDLRSFGKSAGATTFGVREVLDVQAGISALQERGYTQIGTFGFSMGGAAALMTASEDQRIAAVASYGSYASLKKLGYELYGFAPGFNYALTELMALWGRVFLGINAGEQSPRNAAERIHVPVLLMHARDDEQIAFSHAQQLAEAFPKNNENVQTLFFDGPHGYLPPEFDKQLLDFFTQHLGVK